jgi:RND family efflux transporter MFP subunit
MNANRFFSILISLLLIVLIVVVLRGNKQEIDRKAQLSLQVNSVVPVVVTQPQWVEMTPSIVATGKIVAMNSVNVVSKAHGTVLAMYKKTGDRVVRGTPIAKVEDRLLRESLSVAEANLAKAQKDAERYTRLQNAGTVTKMETETVMLALKNAEQQVFDLKDRLENTVITATISGVLNQVAIETGALVATGMNVAEIIDPERLKMEITVSEREVVRIKTGQTASITSDVFPGSRFEGVVSVVGSQGNGALNYTVEIAMPETQDLKPGMFAVATIENDKRQVLAIDRRCITGGMKSPELYVVTGETAKKRSVVVGETHHNMVEIIQGLTENETVVIDGQINLHDDTRVSIASHREPIASL